MNLFKQNSSEIIHEIVHDDRNNQGIYFTARLSVPTEGINIWDM